jgi:hypothetical protein
MAAAAADLELNKLTLAQEERQMRLQIAEVGLQEIAFSAQCSVLSTQFSVLRKAKLKTGREI